MKAYILPFGTLNMPESSLYGLGYPDDKIELAPSYGVLIEHPDGLILFDTGCQTEPEALGGMYTEFFNYNNEDKLFVRLAELNYTPQDITHVVLSHLHFDHVGNVHQFKNAKIFVNRDEFTQTMVNYGMGKSAVVIPQEQINHWYSKPLNWILVDTNELEIVSGITMYNFGTGHSYGMSALLLSSNAGRNIIIASDIAYTSVALKMNPPTFVYDVEGYFKGIKKLKALAQEKQAEIWFGHDREQFIKLKKSPQAYEF